MQKKTGFLIFLIMILSIMLVGILSAVSEQMTHKKNPFIRLFPPGMVSLTRVMDLRFKSYYLAGADRGHFYLGNLQAPLLLMKVDYPLLDSIPVSLIIQPGQRPYSASPTLYVDSPYFFLADGKEPVIWKGSFSDPALERISFDSAFFASIISISPASFILRTAQNGRGFVLAKETNDMPHLRIFPDLLEGEKDSFFSKMGSLLYDRQHHQIIYIYLYRNQYLVLDTNLHLQNKGRTIDTINHPHIQVAYLAKERKFTFSNPPLMVNEKSRVWNHLLFVHSKLMAHNEDPTEWGKTSVIDVYDLQKHQYQFSFYLHDHGPHKMNDFIVCGNHLVALFDHFVLSYQLNEHYFPD